VCKSRLRLKEIIKSRFGRMRRRRRRLMPPQSKKPKPIKTIKRNYRLFTPLSDEIYEEWVLSDAI
jgi:hypothetical protein